MNQKNQFLIRLTAVSFVITISSVGYAKSKRRIDYGNMVTININVQAKEQEMEAGNNVRINFNIQTEDEEEDNENSLVNINIGGLDTSADDHEPESRPLPNKPNDSSEGEGEGSVTRTRNRDSSFQVNAERRTGKDSRFIDDQGDEGNSFYAIKRVMYNISFASDESGNYKVKDGFGLYVGAGYELSENVDMESTWDWYRSDIVKSSSSLDNITSVDGFFDANGINVTGRYYLLNKESFRSYLEAGFGIYRAEFDMDISIEEDNATTKSLGLKGKNWMFGHNLGVGGIYHLGDSFVVEAGYRRKSLEGLLETTDGKGNSTKEEFSAFKNLRLHGLFMGIRYIW